MAEPTLTQVFGASATQSSTVLTISKTDLAVLGLTASANNSAESLFVALLLQAKATLTPTNLETNADQSVSVAESDFNFQTLVTRNNQTYRQSTYSVNLQKIDNSSIIDPDDY